MDLCAGKRRNPDDRLISALLEETGDDWSGAELLANLTVLLLAGFETTSNLLGNGLRLLIDRPEQWERLRGGPGLAGAYVEEALRFDPPVQLTTRRAGAGVRYQDMLLPEGATVTVLIGAANRDPARFGDPAVFDPARPDNQPLSFGGGAHFCLGAALARLEGRTAFAQLAQRFPGLRLDGEPVRHDRLTLRGYSRIPIARG